MLLGALPQKTVYGAPEGTGGAVEVGDITFDSRTVQPGSIFVAIRGWEQDGHRFIPDAVRRGAAAIVAEQPAHQEGASNFYGAPVLVVVPNTRVALAQLAAAYFGFPGRSLRVVGVTGTDGKTTTTTLIHAMLNAAGRRAGMLSTIRAEYGGQNVDTGLHTTTPNPVDVQRYLRAMRDAGATHAVLETTSHALDQERTLGSEFDIGVVTNVTPEHLDYHLTYGRYLAAKGRLFAGLTSSHRKPGIPKVSVTNVDDISYGYLSQFPADLRLTYGIDGVADVMARGIELGGRQTSFMAVTPQGAFTVSTPLPGRYNVYNVLAATAVAIALEVPTEAIVAGAAAVGSLTGRWEEVSTGEDFAVVVDFAHTPRALEEALRLARCQSTGRVIVVFGCAGLRDQTKRPKMGEVAGRLADLIVLTAEDPRTEDVDEIIRQIASGCERAGRVPGRDYFQVPDRGMAIEFAIGLAGPGDLVLLAGKGHERSLCIGDVEHPWSEHEAVATALVKRDGVRQQGNQGKMSR